MLLLPQGCRAESDRQVPGLRGSHFSWRDKSKYINKKLKNIITDHNKGTRRDQGQGHFRQIGEESSRGWKAEKRA